MTTIGLAGSPLHSKQVTLPTLPVMISTSDRHLGRSAEPDIGDHGRSSFRCE
jgi:hypothetical protein